MDLHALDVNRAAHYYIDTLGGIDWESAIHGSLLVGGVLLLWYVLSYLNARRKSSFRRGNEMHPKREKHLWDKTGDYLTEAVEMAVFKEEITRDEARMIYRRLANIFNDRNLLPRGQGLITLKEKLYNKHKKQPAMKAYLAAKHGGKAKLETHKPNIPGEKPVVQLITPANKYAKVLFTKTA